MHQNMLHQPHVFKYNAKAFTSHITFTIYANKVVAQQYEDNRILSDFEWILDAHVVYVEKGIVRIS